MRIAAAVIVACVSLPADAHDWNNKALSSGFHAGILRWSQDYCNGSISAAHIVMLQNERALDPLVFDEAATVAYKESIELAMQSALKFSDAGTDAGRLGNLVVCRVTEQTYGPHGTLWIGAWAPPQGGPTTAK